MVSNGLKMKANIWSVSREMVSKLDALNCQIFRNTWFVYDIDYRNRYYDFYLSISGMVLFKIINHNLNFNLKI